MLQGCPITSMIFSASAIDELGQLIGGEDPLRVEAVVALLHRHPAGERVHDRGPADDERLEDVLEGESQAFPLSSLGACVRHP